LSDESHEAGKIKREDSILVIMGNPPYSATLPIIMTGRKASERRYRWNTKLL